MALERSDTLPLIIEHDSVNVSNILLSDFFLSFRPKGAGKTTLIANLLYFYKSYFHNIYVFSPTVLSDEKWDVKIFYLFIIFLVA